MIVEGEKRLTCRYEYHCLLCRTCSLIVFVTGTLRLRNTQMPMSAPPSGWKGQNLCFNCVSLKFVGMMITLPYPRYLRKKEGKQGYRAKQSLPHSSLPQYFQPHNSPTQERIPRHYSFIQGPVRLVLCLLPSLISRLQCSITMAAKPLAGAVEVEVERENGSGCDLAYGGYGITALRHCAA